MSPEAQISPRAEFTQFLKRSRAERLKHGGQPEPLKLPDPVIDGPASGALLFRMPSGDEETQLGQFLFLHFDLRFQSGG
jgi:hypothetical protein